MNVCLYDILSFKDDKNNTLNEEVGETAQIFCTGIDWLLCFSF